MEFLSELHPKIIHFPIAFLMFYPLIELLFLISQKEFFNKTSFLFLIAGIIGAFTAVLSGNQAFELVKLWPGDSKEVFSLHQTYANISIWYFTVLLVLRFVLNKKKMLKRKMIFFILLAAIAGAFFVFQTGYYGGKLSEFFVTIGTF